jgi:hypothetical protein
VGQWLTTPEVLAAVNTNKKLTSWGIFVPNGSGSTIVMVNGGLMAKPNVELFQQAINHPTAKALAASIADAGQCPSLITSGWWGRTAGTSTKS